MSSPYLMPISPKSLINENIDPDLPSHCDTSLTESFHTSFPFLDPIGGMEYYTSTPEPTSAKEMNSMPRVFPPAGHEESMHTQVMSPTGDCHMRDQDDHSYLVQKTSLSPEGIVHSPLADNNLETYHQPPYDYGASYQHTPPTFTPHTHYHPYRSYSLTSRSPPPFGRPPFEPLSPPDSTSPPSGRYHHAQLEQSPPHAVSPTMVSPTSAIESIGSDLSPPNMGWNYNLPHPHPVYDTTPLESVTNLPPLSPPIGLGMSMVAGFPYATPAPASRRRSSGRAPRPRVTRSQTTGSNIKREEDEDSDDLLERTNGLGFSPESASGRIPLGGRREDVRKARIESEQRRRDELREGFRKLKEVLPESNQRASKSSLLDRSVAHIEHLELSNRYVNDQYAQARQEILSLQTMNAQLVQTLSMNSRNSTSTNTSSPRSAHGKN